MPRAGLSPPAVVDAALAVIDGGGPDALTLAAVAGRTGVATPSLYKHVGGLAELRRLVAIRIFTELAGVLARAVLGLAREDALRALMHAYRGYAVAHPGRYGALPQAARIEPEVAAAGEEALAVILAVLRGFDLTGAEIIHAARCLRSALHGFVALEIGGGFGRPERLDDSFDRLIRMVLAGMTG